MMRALTTILLFNVFFAAVLIIGLQRVRSKPNVLIDLVHLEEEPTTLNAKPSWQRSNKLFRTWCTLTKLALFRDHRKGSRK